jgi:hypothetical protein
MSEILLVALMVLVAFAIALAFTEWAASRLVRRRLKRDHAAGDKHPFGDPFAQDEL